jgi:hypothetical protein
MLKFEHMTAGGGTTLVAKGVNARKRERTVHWRGGVVIADRRRDEHDATILLHHLLIRV